ncbi:Permease of the drug/metabolite transporter (DMT) superfamily [Sphingopyxis sp. YR583]|jgi:drug/metabolite transporter (DMT)-like permease|uniref:DMT family transporter n=1 Tax=Sphingopyxis sp. YR583 TaxID=1881047 RepID=UPI0008A7B496|nr:DMT family transporter [Sphingopyxis sp. YR583]SEH19604.1 Permease of the drug/metabolite transporter (DMT) superfamily [Sphingopyxis sp. YR583]
MAKMGGPAAALWSRAYPLLTVTALCWAGNSIVGRAARDLVPPAALSFWRWSLALLLLLPLAWPHLKRDWPVLRANWAIVALLGALAIGSFNILLYTGLQSTTALNSMLIQSAQPALILIVGALVMGDGTSLRQIGGVLISLAGVLAIVGRGDPGLLWRLQLNIGDAIIGGAVLLWSLYSVLLRRRPAVHPLSFLAASMVVGIAVIIPFYLHELWSGRLIVPTTGSALAIGYVAIFPSFLAYLFFNRGVELIGSAATGQYMNVMPLMGAGLAMLFLGEALHLFHIVGLALIVVGILVAGRPQPAERT